MMLTDSQLAELRRDLVDRLRALYRAVHGEIRAALISRAFEPDPRDEEDEALDDELATIEDEHDRRLAHQLEDALGRMQRREYGICVDCGNAIPFERLRAVPWAERCADDQQRVEEAERTANQSPPPRL